MRKSENYCLSLTGAGTYRAETLEVLHAYLECRDWREVRRLVVEDNLINLNSDGNRKRIGGEIIKRLQTLAIEELEYFDESIDDDQSAMLWVALCRTYPILYSFARNVLAARYANMVPDLPKTSYLAFTEEIEFDHPEYARLTESSKKKIEIRIFGMLRDCRLIDSAFLITPLYPSVRFVELVGQTSPEDLKLFPKVGALL